MENIKLVIIPKSGQPIKTIKSDTKNKIKEKHKAIVAIKSCQQHNFPKPHQNIRRISFQSQHPHSSLHSSHTHSSHHSPLPPDLLKLLTHPNPFFAMKHNFTKKKGKKKRKKGKKKKRKTKKTPFIDILNLLNTQNQQDKKKTKKKRRRRKRRKKRKTKTTP